MWARPELNAGHWVRHPAPEGRRRVELQQSPAVLLEKGEGRMADRNTEVRRQHLNGQQEKKQYLHPQQPESFYPPKKCACKNDDICRLFRPKEIILPY
ncbi:unnamed protein product [Amoebophrya sp. A120]|nr:unnamed protein product [Amoebophrya sp. A120]|eukprot:GSA120T00008624001.1